MRLIDADLLKSKMNKAALGGRLLYYVCGVIDDAPTIDVEPVKCGEWIYMGDLSYCSRCNTWVETKALTSYCGHCGSKNGLNARRLEIGEKHMIKVEEVSE